MTANAGFTVVRCTVLSYDFHLVRGFGVFQRSRYHCPTASGGGHEAAWASSSRRQPSAAFRSLIPESAARSFPGIAVWRNKEGQGCRTCTSSRLAPHDVNRVCWGRNGGTVEAVSERQTILSWAAHLWTWPETSRSIFSYACTLGSRSMPSPSGAPLLPIAYLYAT
jgi:hypothetical protein